MNDGRGNGSVHDAIRSKNYFTNVWRGELFDGSADVWKIPQDIGGADHATNNVRARSVQ